MRLTDVELEMLIAALDAIVVMDGEDWRSQNLD